MPLPVDAPVRLQFAADSQQKKADLNLAAPQAHYNRTVRIHCRRLKAYRLAEAE